MIVKIDRLDDYGRGIALINNKITFIENALPEEVVDIEILKENKKYNEGKVTKYLELSPNRIEAKCPYYTKCGGCNLEHFSYSYENTFKENKVKHLLNKFTNLDENIVKDIKYDKEYSYRNKIILHGNNKKLGLYNKGSNDIIPINKCLLVNNKINEIINILNKINVSIKEVLIRTSNDEKETIVKIDGDVSNINSLLNKVDVLIINNKLLSNNSSIISNIGKYKYYLSSNSFFQINEYLTKTIYDEIEKIVQSIKPNKVLDLYCGTGTIGIYISKYAGNVIGIDSNISNIKDAEKNKLLNNIDNIKFICSKVETKINGFNDIDLIIVDPPRSGLDKITLTNLLRIKPQTLIYTSCDPVTLMRDLNYLNKIYEVKYLIPINNFPRTYHCESIAVLERK